MRSFALGTIAILAVYAAVQHPGHPPASEHGQSEHHACLDKEREALERGEGFGMALAADRSGYPGPKHVLELKSELKLTPAQEAEMEKLMAGMKEKAIARGREILRLEELFEQMFAEGRAEAELREESYRIATLRAQLRWVHLATHLDARKVLNEEQLHAYMRIRHGGLRAH